MDLKKLDILSGLTLALDEFADDELISWLSAAVQAWQLKGQIWDDYKKSIAELKAHQEAGTEPSREERDATVQRIFDAIDRAAKVQL